MKKNKQSYCKNCGAYINKKDKTCPECGTQVHNKMSGEQKAEIAGNIIEAVLDIVEAIID